MDAFIQQHVLLSFILIIGISTVLGLFWQALIQRVWGASIIKQLGNSRAFYLKTRQGEFRVDGTHKRFNFKPKKATSWEAVDFDQVRNLHIFREVSGGALIEFLLGDWGLWDLHGRYRDTVNIYRIQITLKDSRDIAIFVLRQYEQREMWLGQVFLNISLRILKSLNLYREIDEVADEKLDHILASFKEAGFDVQVRR